MLATPPVSKWNSFGSWTIFGRFAAPRIGASAFNAARSASVGLPALRIEREPDCQRLAGRELREVFPKLPGAAELRVIRAFDPRDGDSGGCRRNLGAQFPQQRTKAEFAI